MVEPLDKSSRRRRKFRDETPIIKTGAETAYLLPRFSIPLKAVSGVHDAGLARTPLRARSDTRKASFRSAYRLSTYVARCASPLYKKGLSPPKPRFRLSAYVPKP